MTAAEHDPVQDKDLAHAAKAYFFKELELKGIRFLRTTFRLERNGDGFVPFLDAYEPTPICRYLLPEDVEEWACLASLAGCVIYEVLGPVIEAHGFGDSELIASVSVDVMERRLEVSDVRLLMPDGEEPRARCLEGLWA